MSNRKLVDFHLARINGAKQSILQSTVMPQHDNLQQSQHIPQSKPSMGGVLPVLDVEEFEEVKKPLSMPGDEIEDLISRALAKQMSARYN